MISMAHAGASGLTKTIEANISLFSAAEIRVVLLPVGEAPEEVFQRYASLVIRHRQVELSNVRSFYKEAQKSPFKSFPWRSGRLHFKFLPEEVGLAPAPLAALHSHRRVLGVIGIMSCPHCPDIAKAYTQFEHRCKAFKDAFTLRCFAFEPSDAQAQEDRRAQPNFIMFPPGDHEQLDNHAEVVMHDFAACLLAELERWMLTASPAAMDLHTLVDSPEFTGGGGAGGALEAVQTRLYSDEEIRTKKRYCRLQKAMGDYCLLAGSPRDAQDHYSTAVDLGKTSSDWLWLAEALEGFAAAKVLQAAITNGAFAINRSSVFNDEQQWRTPRARRRLAGTASDAASGGAGGEESEGATPREGEEGEEALSEASSRASSAFGGAQFWAVLRRVEGLESEVRGLFSEGKAAIRRRGALALLAESELKLGRYLAGLHGTGARREVSEVVGALQGLGEALPLPEDRLLCFVEGAQLLGLVGCARKRVLLLWQAVELSKYLGFPNARTLEVARKALEPADDPQEPPSSRDDGEGWGRRRPLAQGAVPRAWGQVRAGCLEAVLGLAIYARQHTDVWDAAAALLREHPGDLSTHRQQSLLENLIAAASQMSPADKVRPGPGPPPLLTLVEPRPPALALRPHRFSLAPQTGGDPSSPQGGSLFLYDPFSARREQAQAAAAAAAQPRTHGAPTCEWVAGELASVEIEVANPASVSVRIDKLVLEAEWAGDPGLAPSQYMTLTTSAAQQPAWKPKPVSLNIPAHTKPVRIQLEGTPLRSGLLVLTGCRLTAFGGVTWFQPWTRPPPGIAAQLAAASAGSCAGGGDDSEGPAAAAASAWQPVGLAAPEARVAVVEPLPVLEMALCQPPHSLDSGVEGLGLLDAVQSAAALGSPGGRARGGTAPGPSLRLLQGQVYGAQVQITNSGRVAVHHASLTSRPVARPPQGRGGGATSSRPPVAVVVDAGALAAAMPLQPGQTVSVGVSFAAGVRAAHAGEEVATQELVLEYVGEQQQQQQLDDSQDEQPPLQSEQQPVASTATSSSQALGRRAVLAVQCHLQPSAQITQVGFRDLYLPVPATGSTAPGSADDTAAAAGASVEEQRQGSQLKEHAAAAASTTSTAAGFERRCVVEVGLANRGRWPLQLWVAPSVDSPNALLPTSMQHQNGSSSSSNGLLQPRTTALGLPLSLHLPPGRRGTLAYMLPRAHMADAVAAAAAASGGQPALPALAPGRGLRSFEDLARQACAERLTTALALYFRVAEEEEEGGEGEEGREDASSADGGDGAELGGSRGAAYPAPLAGMLPLVHGEVFNGLVGAAPMLALLYPPALTARLTVAPLPQQPRDQHDPSGGSAMADSQATCQLHLAPPPEAAAEPHSPYSLFPALRTAVGQPVAVALTVTNTSSSELRFEASMACTPLRSGEGDDAAAAAITASREVCAAWSGQPAGAQVVLPPGDTTTWQLGLCLLAPGLYQLSLQQQSCQPARPPQAPAGGGKNAPLPPPCNTMVAVHPAFVLAQLATE